MCQQSLCFPSLLWDMIVFQTVPVFLDLDSFEACEVFCRMSLNWDYSHVLGKKTAAAKWLSCRIMPRLYAISCLIADDANLITWLRCCFPLFSIIKVQSIPHPHLHTLLFGNKSQAQLSLCSAEGGGKSCFCSFTQEVSWSPYYVPDTLLCPGDKMLATTLSLEIEVFNLAEIEPPKAKTDEHHLSVMKETD